MKKLVLTLVVVLSANLSANAFIDSQYMKTEQYLQNTGYSSEMAKLVNVVALDPYREPYKKPTGFKQFMKKTYNYIIPGTVTDMDFYNHNINVDNGSWYDF